VQGSDGVLDNDGGQVVLRQLVGEAQRLPRAALMMQGAPHHQGNLTLNAYAAKWVRVIHFFIVTLNSA
jgi:hypothetical protein